MIKEKLLNDCKNINEEITLLSNDIKSEIKHLPEINAVCRIKSLSDSIISLHEKQLYIFKLLSKIGYGQ